MAEFLAELSWMWKHLQISWSIIGVGYISHVSLTVMYIENWETGMHNFYVRIIYLVDDYFACLSLSNKVKVNFLKWIIKNVIP